MKTSAMISAGGNAEKFSYLSLINRGKRNGKWNIEIKNPLSNGVIVYYNRKMCFESDVKNWNGLSDIASIVIPSDGIATVQIPKNGFATCAAFCYIVDGYRVISYAYGLSGGNGISVANNCVKL